MKKSLFCLSLLIIALAFIVSCSEPDALTDDLVFASFSNDVMTADLSVSYSGLKSYDSLYWYYTATKCDALGTKGATTILTKVPGDTTNHKGLDGNVGPFSQGKWKFELFAFEEELTPGTDVSYFETEANRTYVYRGATPDSGDKVIHLSKNKTNYIPVSVTPNGQGTVQIDTAFKWDGDGGYTTPLYLSIKVDGVEKLDNTTSVLSPNGNAYPIERSFTLDEGMHTFVFVVKDSSDGDELAIDVLRTKIFAGMTTTITGEQVELTAGEVYFSVPVQDVISKTVTSGQKTEFTSNLAPAKATGSATKITFEQNALESSTLESSINYNLKMTVTPIEAASEMAEASSFSMTGNDNAVVAGVDFKLSKITVVGNETTEDVVEDFGESTYAVVETYIASGLTDVKVWYNGTDKDAPIASSSGNPNVATMFDTDTLMGTALGYSKESGLLRFKTNHFSEYFVTSAAEALNVSANKAYPSFRDALADAVSGAEIKVLKDIALENSIIIDKDITLDLNGKNITVSSSWIAVSPTKQALFYVKSGACFTVNDKATGENGSIDSSSNSSVYSAIMLTISNNNDENKIAKLHVKNGTLIGTYAGVFTNGLRHNTEIIIDGGTFTGTKDGDSEGIYHPNKGKLIINGGTFTGNDGILVKGGAPVTINGGVFEAKGEFKDPDEPAESGCNNVGSALYVEGNYEYGAQVVINGGTFKTTDPDAPVIYSKFNNNANPATISVKGGTFSSDPSTYVHPAYKAIKTQESPETWTVRKRIETDEDAVARIGDDYYASLKDAVDDAKAGETIVMIADYEADEIIEVTKSVTLDTNGKNITFTGCSINGEQEAFQVYCNATDHNVFTLKGNGTILSSYGVVTLFSSNAGVVVDGPTLKASAGAVINTYGANIVCDENYQTASFSGTTSARTIEVKSGTLIAPNVGGSANSIIHCDYGTLTVTGGTFECGDLFAALYLTTDCVATIQNCLITGTGNVVINVINNAEVTFGEGVVITKNKETETSDVFYVQTPESGKLFIIGGSYPVDPKDYVPEGYLATNNNGIWTVSKTN